MGGSGSDLSGLDLLVIQIDGIHMDEDLILVAAIGVDAKGDKHPLGLAEGATENAATVQALIDNLVERGLDPAVPRLFIIDGAKALSKAIRRTFGRAAAIQRCQVHKARNIMERLPKSLHASVQRVLRQAWELDDADKAEKLIRNLAQRLERDWSGVAGSILEGIDEILTVTPAFDCRRSCGARSPAPTLSRMWMSTVRRVCRNVKRWRSASMAMRWTAAAMQEAAKGFRRLKAHKQLPALRAALEAHQNKTHTASLLAKPTPLNINLGSDRFAMFNKVRDIPPLSPRRQVLPAGPCRVSPDVCSEECELFRKERHGGGRAETTNATRPLP